MNDNLNGPLPELDKLVQEIKSGKRVLLFPPGVFFFVAIMILTMIGLGGLIAMTGPLVSSFLNTETVIKIHLGSLLLSTFAIVLSGLMISRGKKRYSFLLKATIATICIGYTGLTLFYFSNSEPNKALNLLIMTCIAYATFYATQRPTFILFCEFFYRLKKAN